MALEQLTAFLEDRPQAELGPTETLPPDGFPLLASSELRAEHLRLSELLEQWTATPGRLRGIPAGAGQAMLQGSTDERTARYMALLERLFAHEARLVRQPAVGPHLNFFGYGTAHSLLAGLVEKGVRLDDVLLPTLRWMAAHQNLYYATPLIASLLDAIPPDPIGEVRDALANVWAVLSDDVMPVDARTQKERLEALLGDGPRRALVPGEVWTDAALAELERMPPEESAAWFALLDHCQSANSAKPSSRWAKKARGLVEPVGQDAFVRRVVAWFALVDRARSRPYLGMLWDSTDDRQRVHRMNGNVLRGLLWISAGIDEPSLTRAVTSVAISAYRKVRGLGPRAVKVGNAAVYALGQMPGDEAVAQLAILKVRVKFGTAQKGIEKALTAAADRLGMPKDDLEEISVPAYGLTELGACREPLGEVTAELTVAGRRAELSWRKADGKTQKSVPASVKRDFPDELKELKRAARDIDKMLPVQAARIEQSYLRRKRWPVSVWRERYADHPLVGVLARRLIWNVIDAERSRPAMLVDGRLVGVDEEPLAVADDHAEIELWHPLDADAGVVGSWRSFLARREIRQPFKQAHREIYLLTDAERRTGTYSNRFASHLLRQHPFNALCAARGWKAKLRLLVDDFYPPACLELSAWGLRAEFWIEGVGDNYGVDTTEAGAFLLVATDQVRFYREGAAANEAHAGGGGYAPDEIDREAPPPLPLDEVPPLVFSEVLRDVDLFVGVASVGNDPTWQDGGPEGRYRDYWQDYAFGELTSTAHTRKEVLETLVPKLEIADRCSLSGRFLRVRGDRRSYRIHLGSGNVLMEPGDQYLCIVPRQSARAAGRDVLLPFEGDTTLSIILSKAFLLAADTKIEDPTILSQIDAAETALS